MFTATLADPIIVLDTLPDPAPAIPRGPRLELLTAPATGDETQPESHYDRSSVRPVKAGDAIAHILPPADADDRRPAPRMGANVVVDVSNSPSWADDAVMEFFDKSTRNLLAAEKTAGVGHHVALSVVGADRMTDSGYMRAKVHQEGLIEAGGVPFTIVRATQFFEFLGGIAGNGDGDIRLPTAPMQPLPLRERRHAEGGRGPGGPLFRRGAGRAWPESRSESDPRADAVRGLVPSRRSASVG